MGWIRNCPDSKKFKRMVCAAVIVAFGTCTVAGQIDSQDSTNHDWSQVTSLSSGLSLRVQNRLDEMLEGRLLSVSMNEIVIQSGRSTYTISRSDIQRIEQRRGTEAGKRSRIGAIVGSLTGAAVGGLTPKSNRLLWALFLSAGWAAFGAAIGALDGATVAQYVLIYDAP